MGKITIFHGKTMENGDLDGKSTPFYSENPRFRLGHFQ
jgi:hypothetical protein